VVELNKPRLLAEILSRRVVPGSHESAARSDASLPDPADWLQEVSVVLEKLPNAGDNEFKLAQKTLYSYAERALKHAKAAGPSLPLDADEAGAMEALIVLDGSRPSLLLRKGTVDKNDPWIGKWKTHIAAIESTIEQCAACVGRIELHRDRAPQRFGTGFLFDTGRGLALTAAHVLRDMKAASAHNVAGDVVRFNDGPVIDFRGEHSLTDRHRLKIVAGAVVDQASRLDVAVIKVRPYTPAEAKRCGEEISDIPAAVELRRQSFDDPPIAGDFCVIGYPDWAPSGTYIDATGSKEDWMVVVERLLGGAYGVKRLAPGFALSQPLQSGVSASRFGHDATTLTGSSGSPVFAWNDAGNPVFGVHVAGAVLSSNFAEWVPGFDGKLAEIEKAAWAAPGK
jgi:hypothetical protein